MYGIKFLKIDNELILEYTPIDNAGWIIEKLYENEIVSIKKIFDFSRSDLFDKIDFDKLSEDDTYNYESVRFVIAKLENNYYKFDKNIFEITYDLYMIQNMNFKEDYFIAKGNISIFSKINNLLANNIVKISIGNDDDTFSIEHFNSMIKNFPNRTELEHYYNARLNIIITDFIQTKKNSEEVYKKYMNKKVSVKGENILDIFMEYEKNKYAKILEKLEFMLNNEDKYNEANWQTEILQIILLIFPKYCRAFEEVTIKETDLSSVRYLDIMLVDSNGHIDILEIKQPFSAKNIISHNNYRNNHIPLRELSGSIMQVEKYIYNLTRWGERGEKELTKRYAIQLPKDLKIKITNPNGLIIMGREQGLTDIQKKDLEIIKRKYKNVIDIITYDDLIQRLKNIIEA